MESFSNELQNALRKPLKDFVKTKMTEAELNNFIKRFKKFQSINDTRFLLVYVIYMDTIFFLNLLYRLMKF